MSTEILENLETEDLIEELSGRTLTWHEEFELIRAVVGLKIDTLLDKQKLDLIVENFHKVSLESFSGFFQENLKQQK